MAALVPNKATLIAFAFLLITFGSTSSAVRVRLAEDIDADSNKVDKQNDSGYGPETGVLCGVYSYGGGFDIGIGSGQAGVRVSVPGLDLGIGSGGGGISSNIGGATEQPIYCTPVSCRNGCCCPQNEFPLQHGNWPPAMGGEKSEKIPETMEPRNQSPRSL